LTIVLDSNVVVALVTKDERAAAVGRQMQTLGGEGEVLHAPSLLSYEVANALTRKVVAGELDLADAETAWRQITAMPIVLHDLDDGPEAIGIALKLRRESAYDASYVALAQELDADLLTLDGPLARNAASAGLPVQLIDIANS
jgi:predicted nucleic acid-binding protein